MKGVSDTYLGNRDFKTYNGILGGKPRALKTQKIRSVQEKYAPLDDSNIFQISSAIINAGKIILPIGIISSAAAAAYNPHSDSGHADMGDVQMFIDGYGSHGDGIRTPPSDDIGKSVNAYKNTKKVAYDSPIKMAGLGDSGNANSYPDKDVKKSDSDKPSWLENFFKGLEDYLNKYFLPKIDAYADATDKITEGKTEEQKEAMRCKEPIYGKNTPGCPTYVSKDSVQNQLGGEPKSIKTPTALPDSAKPVINGEMPVDWDELQMHYTQAKGDIMTNSYVEEVACGSHNGKFYLGAKVKEGTPDDRFANVWIQGRFKRLNYPRMINVVLWGNAYRLANIKDVENPSDINVYVNDGWRVAEIPEFPELVKEDDVRFNKNDTRFDINRYMFYVLDDERGNILSKRQRDGGKYFEIILLETPLIKN